MRGEWKRAEAMEEERNETKQSEVPERRILGSGEKPEAGDGGRRWMCPSLQGSSESRKTSGSDQKDTREAPTRHGLRRERRLCWSPSLCHSARYQVLTKLHPCRYANRPISRLPSASGPALLPHSLNISRAIETAGMPPAALCTDPQSPLLVSISQSILIRMCIVVAMRYANQGVVPPTQVLLLVR